MSEGVPSIKHIIANTINEKAFGDPDALAAHIVHALTENRIWIVPEDTALGAQPFDELTPEMRPQHSSLNNLLPRNRALGYRRVIPLVGITPIPHRGCGCVSIGRVTIAVIISTVIGSRC
jgi:hypothetical protein